MRRFCPQKTTGRLHESRRPKPQKNGRSTHARAVLLLPVIDVEEITEKTPETDEKEVPETVAEVPETKAGD